MTTTRVTAIAMLVYLMSSAGVALVGCCCEGLCSVFQTADEENARYVGYEQVRAPPAAMVRHWHVIRITGDSFSAFASSLKTGGVDLRATGWRRVSVVRVAKAAVVGFNVLRCRALELPRRKVTAAQSRGGGGVWQQFPGRDSPAALVLLQGCRKWQSHAC